MKKGFTLVELICCICIMSILLLIAAPSVPGINSIKKKTVFSSTSQELLKDLRYARVRAMTNGVVKVHFYDDGYILYDYSDSKNMIFKKVTYEDGIRFIKYKSTIPSDRELHFTQTGTVSPYACTVVIQNTSGETCTISIKVTTFTIDFKR